jgi:hypothetical protein
LTNVVRGNQIYNQNYKTKAVFDDYDDDYTASFTHNFDHKRRKENRYLRLTRQRRSKSPQRLQIGSPDPNKKITVNFDQL